MNSDANNVNRASGAAVGFIVASLIFIALAVVVKCSLKAPAMDADRAAVRAKALAEIRATEDKSLNAAGWVDPSRGIVRLPIEDAMRLIEKQGASGTRATLIQREAQASAPAKTNPLE